MSPADLNKLKSAIARRIGAAGSPEPTVSQGLNPNVLKLMQVLRMAQQNQTPPPAPMAPSGVRMGIFPGENVSTPVERPGAEVIGSGPQQNPMMPPPQPTMQPHLMQMQQRITKLPQQHSQIGLQAPYQAFGGNPMQAAAQKRLGAGPNGNQGNYGGGYGGGSETTPPGVNPKQDKHRKVTIEEYR